MIGGRLKRALFADLELKIVALLLAILAWALVHRAPEPQPEPCEPCPREGASP